mmetsp:Transcript_3121/g.7158  ORF Transcript_3121/g.7158 Transcript_3121/m.7158 type:complete len:755 (-) Transcript_3121:198-2462(-)
MRRSTHGEVGKRDSAYEYTSTDSNEDNPKGDEGRYGDNVFDSEVEGGMAGAVASVEVAQEAWGNEEGEELHHSGMDEHPAQYDLHEEDGSNYRGEVMEHEGGDGGDDVEDPNSPDDFRREYERASMLTGAAPMQYGQYEEDGVRAYGEEEEGEDQYDGSLLPPPVDRHEEYDDPPFYKTMTGRIVICVALIGIALCLMAIGIVQPWNKNSGADVQSGPTRAPSPPTSRPTPSWYINNPSPTRPSSSLTNEQRRRYQEFYSALVTAEQVSSPADMVRTPFSTASTTRDTPQQKALNWIAFEDDLQLKADEDPVERIAQRYSLAVLYYATNGESWLRDTGWLTGREHECTWYGLECENRQIVESANNQATVTVTEAMVTEINLEDNNLDGGLTREIGVFRFLLKMSLYSNKVSSRLPSQIGELADLEYLWIDNNRMGGPLPSEIGRMNSLIQMDIYSNRFSSSIPTTLGQLRNLERFSAYSNLLQGSIPTQIGNMNNLRELFLDSNSMGGSIPSELGRATALYDLRLFDNNLIGSIPSALSNLEDLEILYLDSNELTGPITVIEELQSLVDFQAFRNRLTGTISNDIGDLEELSVLDLNTNRMRGNIPDSLGESGSLEKLDLSKNEFGGNIPEGLEECTGLKKLRLNNNVLVGSIPEWMGDLDELRELLLATNRLSGPIPEELGELSQLNQLTLEFNELRGDVSTDLCDYNVMRLSADCEGANAPVECQCCTACCDANGCVQLSGVSATARTAGLG